MPFPVEFFEKERNPLADLEKLSDLFSDVHYHENLAVAKAKETCVRCGLPAHDFRSLPAKIEYDVSALCQICQDELFSFK